MAIERFYDSSSSEFKAQQHIRDNIFHDPNISIQTMAACAAYAAVLRYATRGRDEYPIAPRNVKELSAVLTNHTVDVIHSLISQTRTRLPNGSYPLARRLAAESITNMLTQGDNADVLLAIHSPDLFHSSSSTLVLPSRAATPIATGTNSTLTVKTDDSHDHHHHDVAMDSGIDNGQQQYFEHSHEHAHDGACCYYQRA